MEPIGSSENGKPVSRFEFNILVGFLIGIAVVAVVCLVTLTISSFNGSQASYDDMRSKLIETNTKMDVLYKLIDNEKNVQVNFPVSK